METNKVNAIVEKIRREPFHVLPMRNNCLGKSLRFKAECRKIGVRGRVVFSLGIIRNTRFCFPPSVLMFHAWGEKDGQRIELARPLDEKNTWGTLDIDIRPLIAIWIY